jgi:hypothetical protein
MNYTKEALELCKTYNFSLVIDKPNAYATGIGDILYLLVAIKNGLINAPAYLGLHYFTFPNEYYIAPLNALEFRLQLLRDLLPANGLPHDSICWSLTADQRIEQISQYASFRELSLELPPAAQPSSQMTTPYIVIHTKIRHNWYGDAAPLKAAIKEFAANFRTSHTIVILGEKVPLNTTETQWHNIQTCYAELVELSANNRVIDLTTTNFDTLNYENYTNDVGLISNAVTNISFGGGGSFCTAMIFGKSTYAHQTLAAYNPDALKAHDSHIYADYNQMIADIMERFGAKA